MSEQEEGQVEESTPRPDETDPTDVDWEENEPSPHQGEQGQEPV
jgi:hypothetical protein